MALSRITSCAPATCLADDLIDDVADAAPEVGLVRTRDGGGAAIGVPRMARDRRQEVVAYEHGAQVVGDARLGARARERVARRSPPSHEGNCVGERRMTWLRRVDARTGCTASSRPR